MVKSISAVNFPELRKVHLDFLPGKGLKWVSPHSLGTLIEWKPSLLIVPPKGSSSPHSLGTLIEWKHQWTR